MGDVSKNFSFREFSCPCCGKQDISIELVDKLQQVRNMLGKSMVITSGYRCPTYNATMSKSTSSHIKGLAADIACTDAGERDELVGFLRTKFTRYGVKKDCIHVDIDKDKRSPAFWTYD